MSENVNLYEIENIVKAEKVSCEAGTHCEYKFNNFNNYKVYDINMNFVNAVIFDSYCAWHEEIAWQLGDARKKIKDKYNTEIFPLDLDVVGLCRFENDTFELNNVNLINLIDKELKNIDNDLNLQYVLVGKLHEEENLILHCYINHYIKYLHLKKCLNFIKKMKNEYNVMIYLFTWYKY